jgi:hypothetical protein
LLLLIKIFLNFFFNLNELLLFLFETVIFLYLIFELQIPSITDEAIFPVPINPNLTSCVYQLNIIFPKKKAPYKGGFKFDYLLKNLE